MGVLQGLYSYPLPVTSNHKNKKNKKKHKKKRKRRKRERFPKQYVFVA